MFNIDELNFNNLDERLQNIDKQQVLDLIKRYYRNEKINDLLKEYKIKTTNSNLIKILPGVWSSDVCEYCEERFVIPLASKSDNNPLDERNKTCSNCNHNPNSYFCDCLNCKEKREKEMEEALKKAEEAEQAAANAKSEEDKIKYYEFAKTYKEEAERKKQFIQEFMIDLDESVEHLTESVKERAESIEVNDVFGIEERDGSVKVLDTDGEEIKVKQSKRNIKVKKKK